MTESSQNTLRIETESLEVTLAGEPESVADAYDAIRELLIERFEATLEGPTDGGGNRRRLADEGTQPLHRAPDEFEESPHELSEAVRTLVETDDTSDASGIVQLIVRHNSHTTAYVLEDADLDGTFLGRTLDPTSLRRLYADASLEDELRDDLAFGKTVWRELTTEGRGRVEREATTDPDTPAVEESDDS